MMGRPDTMRLLSEAPETYVHGQFVASLMLAAAYVEHTLMEELERAGVEKKRMSLELAIEEARQRKLFAEDWLRRADSVRLKRNPFSHLRRPDDPDTLGQRYMRLSTHPDALMQADAEEALELMYDMFVATLREATW